jgi:hypothetical protein
MTDQPLPTEQARKLRKRAAELVGPERDYFLWLALEWEKSAARYSAEPQRFCRQTAPPSPSGG